MDEADAVVVAVPPAPSVRLLRGVCDAAANELAGIESASMAIVTLVMPASAFPSLPETSGFLVPAVEGRTIKAVTYSSAKWPWLGERASYLVILRASVGRHREVAQLQRSDGDLVGRVRKDLREIAGISGEPIDARVTRWGGALPQYAVGHRERVSRIRSAVADVPGLAVCGAVYDGVGIAACIASARSAVTSLLS
jgi:oxygen-dependent protoporphyrinogen oxidase